ncbi:MAG: hypothetical protein M3228_09800 [Actinomycetota bacterium]|nr:hypothetical protein [Actinomycetota bacterium]
MNTPQEHHDEQERPQGPGGRVRRFLDSEEPVGTQTGHPGGPDLECPGRVAQGEPVTPNDAPAHVEQPAATASDDTARDGSAQQVGLINDVAGLRDEWQRVQGTFVDDPQRAVHEAGVLIDRTLDEIRMNVGSGPPSETTSTEDLRVSFQRYREFFQRLLSA